MTDPAVSNVVLVTVDSLRADAVGTDADDERTPEIGRLAEEGVSFEHAFAHGNWTPFSFPSILGSRSVFADKGTVGLADSPSLAERLRDADVRTGGFNAANGFLTSHWGYDRGFEQFESFVGGRERWYSRYLAAHPTVQAWLQLATSPFRRLANRIRGGSDDRPFADTSRLLDVENRAVEFIESTGEPFFLWLHYMDTHTPYVPAPQYLRSASGGQLETHRIIRAHVHTGLGWRVGEGTLSDLRALYSGTVRQADASIGRVREALSAAGVADDTGIVVAGDHGEEFMEHGHLAHYPKLYDELVHVPLVVSVPGLEGPSTVEEAVGLEAIPPTVCDLLGVEPSEAWEGESLGPTLRGEGRPEDGPVVSVTVRGDGVTQQPIPRTPADGDVIASARTARWTYIENTATGERELYDRTRDPTQQHDLYEADEQLPSIVPELADAVRDHVTRLHEGEATDEIDDDVATRLDALGYR